MDAIKKLASALDAMALCFQVEHWNAKGECFYADHMLFRRLYDGLEVDDLVEKSMAVYGPKMDMDSVARAKALAVEVEKCSKDHLAYAMATCKGIEVLLGQVKNEGLKNLLQGIEDSLLTKVYLLQRREMEEDEEKEKK